MNDLKVERKNIRLCLSEMNDKRSRMLFFIKMLLIFYRNHCRMNLQNIKVT